MENRKTYAIFWIILLIVSISTYGFVYGATNQEKLDKINDQKKEVASDISQMVKSIKSQKSEIEKLENSILKKEAEISKAQAEIDSTIIKINKRKDGLNSRLRIMYKSGSIGYLDIILSSKSLSEFFSNLELVQRIYKSDQKTLEDLKVQHDQLVKKQNQLKLERSSLREKKIEAYEKKEALMKDKKKLQGQLDKLNEEAEELVAKIAAMQDSHKVYTGGKFAWPTTSTLITSNFGGRIHPVTGIYTGHTGVDIGVSTGSPIYAAAAGTVILSSAYGGYGYAVIIDHGSGISTLYGHNSSLNVSVGQQVSKGQVIARSGSTGISTGPHLHYEIRINGQPVDPMSYYN